MQENVKPRIAVWHWSKGEPVPDTKVVVCEPGLFGARRREQLSGVLNPSAMNAAWRSEGARQAGAWIVMPDDGDTMKASADCGGPCPLRFIPALHIRTQSDLAGLPGLLAVKAERRAIVCSPEEAIDCGALQMRARCSICARDNVAIAMSIVCAKCPRVDVVFIVGFDKPMHPSWARGIVEQCRAAGVPCVLVTWGEWGTEPFRGFYMLEDVALFNPKESEMWIYLKDIEEERRENWDDHQWGDVRMYRIGTDNSGALLDGAKVEDWPDWMGGENV